MTTPKTAKEIREEITGLVAMVERDARPSGSAIVDFLHSSPSKYLATKLDQYREAIQRDFAERVAHKWGQTVDEAAHNVLNELGLLMKSDD